MLFVQRPSDLISRYLTGIASTGIRLGSWIFLRWIPGHLFPPTIFTLFAIYAASFWYNLTHTASFDVSTDVIDVITINTDGSDDALDLDPEYTNRRPTGQELDVVETIVLEEKPSDFLKSLALGLPSPSSLLISICTFAINIGLVAMVLDLIYTGPLFYKALDLSMARVGYVSASSAKILVREADASLLPITVSYRHAGPPLSELHHSAKYDTTWKTVGTIEWLDYQTDYTSTLELKGLRPDTRYQWAASNNHSGYFTTAPRIGHTSDRAETAGIYTFLHSSCLKNRFPYSPAEHSLSNKGLRYLAKALPALHAQFMLFLGDFIYADVPRRHGITEETYRSEYRQVYASPDWTPATRNLPWIHVYDDHEIANDWSANTTGIFTAANGPFKHYHTSVNPPAIRNGESYFSFTQGPATFFMLDTRRYRSPNDRTNGSDPRTGEPTKSMLGQPQLSDLLAWLKRSEEPGVRWKVLVSSIPFTKNWWFGAQDTWRGYLGERQIILEAMWDVGLRGGVGVIILSGDRHEFAATAFPPPPGGKEEIIGLGRTGRGATGLSAMIDRGLETSMQTRRKYWPISATVHEFSASPLSMFYLPVRTYAESSTSLDYISDVCVKYIPDGNSKFGAVSITNPVTSDQSILHYKLFVDGTEAWSYTITAPPAVAGGGRAKDAIWG